MPRARGPRRRSLPDDEGPGHRAALPRRPGRASAEAEGASRPCRHGRAAPRGIPVRPSGSGRHPQPFRESSGALLRSAESPRAIRRRHAVCPVRRGPCGHLHLRGQPRRQPAGVGRGDVRHLGHDAHAHAPQHLPHRHDDPSGAGADEFLFRPSRHRRHACAARLHRRGGQRLQARRRRPAGHVLRLHPGGDRRRQPRLHARRAPPRATQRHPGDEERGRPLDVPQRRWRREGWPGARAARRARGAGVEA